MTTPPPADNDPKDPASPWAPPDALAADLPVPGDAAPAGWPAQDVPPHAFGPPPAAVPSRTNRLAIVALVTGLFGLVLLAVGFAVAALVQTGRRGERGRGLAVGGIVASAVWAVVGAVALAAAGGSPFTADRDGAGGSEGGKVPISKLREGDCFTFTGGVIVGRRTDLVTAVPCTKPHDSEVVAQSSLPEGPYPGDRTAVNEAARMCAAKITYLNKSRYAKKLEPYFVAPQEADWAAGDHGMTCVMRFTGPGTLTAPLAATVDPNLKSYHHLKVGDCVKDLDPEEPVVATVPCTEPHRSQVYATFWIELDAEYAPGDYPPYPGWDVIEKKAIRFCDSRAKKLFAERPPPVGMQEQYAAPNEQDWREGIRAVVCLLRTEKGSLRRSVVPH